MRDVLEDPLSREKTIWLYYNDNILSYIVDVVCLCHFFVFELSSVILLRVFGNFTPKNKALLQSYLLN